MNGSDASINCYFNQYHSTKGENSEILFAQLHGLLHHPYSQILNRILFPYVIM